MNVRSSPRSRSTKLGIVVLAAGLGVGACDDPTSPVGGGGSLFLTPLPGSVEVGETLTLYATGLSENGIYALGSVTWSSSDESVATVESSRTIDVFGAQSQAIVRAVGEGTATITVDTSRLGDLSVTVTVVATEGS